MKKVGHTSEFLFGIYTSKIILIFKMLQFFKNIKKNTWRYYFTSAYQKSWYDLQFLRHWAWWTEICNFRSLFAFFTPFKTKKITGDIIILLSGTKNPNQMMHSSWDTEQSETETIFVILGISCPFNDPENQILEKWKKCLEILTFHKCVP